ncbi:MAG: ATP-binding protein [Treponema sp.]|jgi:hypothetical protein|nr:ATP-binding protein [Treponema sp.]
MKNIIIKDERNHRVISGNAISILDRLPASIFELHFDPDSGFSLNEIDNRFNITGKLYGEVETITSRVLETFDSIEGNLGVLFSGPKGLGKSLTTRNICREAIKKDLPVILVTEHFENISRFIETISQPSVIVFDEFEKIYPDRRRTERDEFEGQESLLNLFDSALNGKKLFLLTCNDLGNVSEYLLNRPGRIHYHFKAHRLTIDEITEYCGDKLPPELTSIIPEICSLGAHIPDFSYDMLKAVIFELKTYRCSLLEAKRILNIEAQSRSAFDFTVYFKSGKIETGFDYIDPSKNRFCIDWYGKLDGNRDRAIVNMTKARWTGKQDGSLLLDGNHVHWSSEDEKSNDRVEKVVFIPARTSYAYNEY